MQIWGNLFFTCKLHVNCSKIAPCAIAFGKAISYVMFEAGWFALFLIVYHLEVHELCLNCTSVQCSDLFIRFVSKWPPGLTSKKISASLLVTKTVQSTGYFQLLVFRSFVKHAMYDWDGNAASLPEQRCVLFAFFLVNVWKQIDNSTGSDDRVVALKSTKCACEIVQFL